MTRALSPALEGAPRVSPLWTVLRLLGGWALVGLLAYLLWTPGNPLVGGGWVERLLAWVLLTILADEFGGWFGYISVLLGGLPFFAPGELGAQWPVIVPLVGGALLALLLVKHSGGAFVLPFAAVVFALPLLALGRYGTKLDPELTLPGNSTFQLAALAAMLAGLAFSFVRQLVGVAWRYGRRRQAAQAALTGASAAPDATLPATTATEVVTAAPLLEEPGAPPVPSVSDAPEPRG